MEWVALAMFATVIALLLVGFPVAFSLGGTALLFALGGIVGGGFEDAFLRGLPSRIFGIMSNETLIAVPAVRVHGRDARASAHRGRSAGDLKRGSSVGCVVASVFR